MSHNKMYREIPGYEDALYATTDTMDELEELYSDIQIGKNKMDILQQINEIEIKINKIKEHIA